MIVVNVQFVHFILETRAGTIDSTPVATRGTDPQRTQLHAFQRIVSVLARPSGVGMHRPLDGNAVDCSRLDPVSYVVFAGRCH